MTYDPVDTNDDGIVDADVDNQSVSTDDIPLASWEKWAGENWAASDHIWWDISWKGADALTTTSGSGSVTTSGTAINCDSGSTDGSVAEAMIRRRPTTLRPTPSYSNRWLYRTVIDVRKGTSDRTDYYTVGEKDAPDNGRSYFGFKISSGELKGVVHDGTSETSTTLLTSGSFSTGTYTFLADFNGPDGTVAFEVNGTEEGTISTGLPTGDAGTSVGAVEVLNRVTNTTATQRFSFVNTARVVMV